MVMDSESEQPLRNCNDYAALSKASPQVDVRRWSENLTEAPKIPDCLSAGDHGWEDKVDRLVTFKLPIHFLGGRWAYIHEPHRSQWPSWPPTNPACIGSHGKDALVFEETQLAQEPWLEVHIIVAHEVHKSSPNFAEREVVRLSKPEPMLQGEESSRPAPTPKRRFRHLTSPRSTIIQGYLHDGPCRRCGGEARKRFLEIGRSINGYDRNREVRYRRRCRHFKRHPS